MAWITHGLTSERLALTPRATHRGSGGINQLRLGRPTRVGPAVVGTNLPT